MMLRIDCHVHTNSSHDSTAWPKRVIEVARRRELSAIAVTDHDSVDGALRAADARVEGDPDVVPGVELTVPMGKYGLHIIGLFVTRMRPVAHWSDALELIREQDGVVVLPHLCRTGTGLLYHHMAGNLTSAEADELLASADYVEGFNYKSRPETTREELEFLSTHSKPIIAGTDAHIPAEVGLAWTEIDDLAEFRKGRSSTRACMLFKGPAPRRIGVGQSGDWLEERLIGPVRTQAGRPGERKWKQPVKKVLATYPLSYVGEPIVRVYRRWRATLGEESLSRRIESDLRGSFAACVALSPGTVSIQPREGF